jgi:glycosyltransferase involved in cell wall biosynthesis
MKVLHVIPSLSLKHGGPSFAVSFIVQSLLETGVAVDVATTDDDGPGCRMNVPLGQRLERDGYGLFYFRKQTEFYKVSLSFNRWIASHASDYDVISLHAIFSFTTTSAAHHARRSGVPYVLIPHGILNRWGMENRRPLLKSLSFRFLENSILRHAAAMYYTSHAERREAEQTGATARAAVIPHGINAAEFQNLPSAEIFLNRFPRAKGRKLVLFLSRLDPKKALELLLPAFAQARRKHPTAMLVIAGSGDASYVAGLRGRADQLGIAGEILWIGFVGGADKLAVFAAATVFVLPSYSENFGIALLEAMASGLPCLTTPGVALAEEVQSAGPGNLLVVPAEVKPLSEALDQLLGDSALRKQLGANAARMAAERFSRPAIGVALKKLYEEILLPGRMAGPRLERNDSPK